MSKRKRELTGEEKQLWRRVAVTVKPRRAPKPHDVDAAHAPPKPAAASKPSPASVPALTTGGVQKAAPLTDRGGEKRVRRGRLEIGATLDLHGHTQVSARNALARFLVAARRRGDQTVIVVTGVGRAGQGVLRALLPEWLAAPDLRPLISGFAQAHRSHGGAGAYYVFLKRRAD